MAAARRGRHQTSRRITVVWGVICEAIAEREEGVKRGSYSAGASDVRGE